MASSLFSFDLAPSVAFVIVLATALLAAFDLSQRFKHRRTTHYVFACVFGSLLALALMKTGDAFLHGAYRNNPHAMALGILLLILGWKSLFGPWEASTKAAILGTFLFWILFRFVGNLDRDEWMLHLVAALVALVPAVVWCKLFLKYHRERFSVVLLMFFSGMLSTLPVLVYDRLVRSGADIDFFLFRIVPESFNRSTEAFVSGQLGPMQTLQATLVTSFLSFLLVGVIEELSKAWMVKRNGTSFMTSIDDAMQLSIMAAIGFAFAENVVNPTYFIGFIKQYIMGSSVDVASFMSNIVGRSVLTSMVHIVSTGVLGYFLGLAMFARPYLAETERMGRHHRFLKFLQGMLRVDIAAIYRVQMLTIGVVSAILLHGAFNFLVTVSDLLPGRPETIGEIFGISWPVVSALPILLFPALFYVLGGFWLLTTLFMRKTNEEERGRIVNVETFVKAN